MRSSSRPKPIISTSMLRFEGIPKTGFAGNRRGFPQTTALLRFRSLHSALRQVKTGLLAQRCFAAHIMALPALGYRSRLALKELAVEIVATDAPSLVGGFQVGGCVEFTHDRLHGVEQAVR